MKKGKGRNNCLLPNSLRIISSCLKTVSSNATNVASSVRTAGASVAASISASSEDPKDQVTWAGFDKLELGPSLSRRVLLLGYQNGFQVLDVEDASNFNELVSKRDGPVTFMQMQPFPAECSGPQGFRASHPILLVVSREKKADDLSLAHNHGSTVGLSGERGVNSEASHSSPTTVQFFSVRSHGYVHVLRFRSAVCMVRCSPRIVAVGLAAQIYCFDAVTLENRFVVLTYPVPQLAGQGPIGVNLGYGPMAVGPRWLAYASNNPLSSNTSRLSPQSFTPSPGISPSTSPSSGNLVARYAMESSKHLVVGIINLGEKTLSKYCQELIPDGSNSPVSSSSGWKVGRLSASESENAGMVVVKDFVSRAVISQFKAHTSPISALCFDPSGTLLVTASVYGNTINVFRIMPCSTRSGSKTEQYNWSSSHVHLYRLHRGMTPAIIQDICFSQYSQWVGIVSSKGTCHVFVLSPFGGDPGFQGNSSKGEEVSLSPSLSVPWWSNSSSLSNHQTCPPPSPLTLSVVSRIKYNDSGWLNTISNAAASATGKVFVPSGAVAAVFHNSLCQKLQDVNLRLNALEYLLVYTPSGHVIQHKIIPSLVTEANNTGNKHCTGSFLQIQEDELRLKVVPVQWWDVCRRSDWPEREECDLETTFVKQDNSSPSVDQFGSEDNCGMDLLDINETFAGTKSKSREGSHWFLSNSELQVNSRCLPVWNKSEICLYTISCQNIKCCDGGEFEVEALPAQEVEIKRKELLPVFDHFHSIKSGWNDRNIPNERYPTFASPEPRQPKLRVVEETVICHSKPSSLSSTESSDGGSSRRIDNLLELDQITTDKPYGFTYQSLDDLYQEKRGNFTIEPMRKTSGGASENLPQTTATGPLPVVATQISASSSSELFHPSNDKESQTYNPLDLGELFKEGYCQATCNIHGCLESTETLNDDIDSCTEKPDDEMFAFSEDG